LFRPPSPALGHHRDREEAPDLLPVEGVDAENIADGESVIGALNDPNRIARADIFFSKPFPDYTAEDFKSLVSTNLEGFLYVTQLAIKQMLARKTGGNIITITAALARNPVRGGLETPKAG
jgi:NAD(P)-dependent dehydrogenase (short-subunit alcohol dehydrogenase family)